MKPKKGGILTPTGQEKIQSAIQTSFAEQNIRVSSAKVAQQTGIPLDELIAILYRQSVQDLKSLKSLFKTFKVKLKREDYDIIKTEDIQPPSQSGTVSSESPIEEYLGRDSLRQELVTQLQQETWIVVLQGIAGMGKTAFVKQLLAVPSLKQEFPLIVSIDYSRNSPQFAIVARQLLGEAISHKILLEGGETALVDAVVAKLQSQPCLLWLDSVEELLQEGQFRSPLFAELFLQLSQLTEMRSRLILTTQTPLTLQHPHTTNHSLSGLDLETVEQLFKLWGVQLNQESDQKDLAEMVKVYEGHPLTLKIMAGEIRHYPYYGNLRAYWHDYGFEYDLKATDSPENAPEAPSKRNLRNWVYTTLERACQRLYSTYPLAYELLCLGANNAKPTDSQGWRFLIGDFPNSDQEFALDILKQRFLLETEATSATVHYRLHNFLRKIILTNLPQAKSKG